MCRTKLYFCVFLCGMLILLTSCQNYESVVNTFWEPASECQPPCWLGIIPGLTNETQAQKILSNPNLVEQERIFKNENEGNPNITNEYQFGLIDDGLGYIGFSDGTVRHTRWNPESSNGTSLADVQERLGMPNAIVVYPKGRYYVGDIFWEQGVRVGIVAIPEDDDYSYRDNENYIYPGMAVTEFTFFDPTSFQDYREWYAEMRLASPKNAETYVSNVHEWKGYGFYSFTGELSLP